MKIKAVLLIAALAVSGCAKDIRPTVDYNPAPTRAFKDFAMFEIKPVVAAPEVDEPKAMMKLQANLDDKVQPVLAQWKRDQGPTLLIEPFVHELKFIDTASRVFLGSLPGNSGIRMTVKMTDRDSGDVIAEPEFFQRAFSMGGAYSFSATDHAMLIRMSSVLSEYLRRNYEKAIGGPTGLESSEQKTKP